MALFQAPLNLANRTSQGLASRARNIYYRILGVHIQGYCWLRAVEIPRKHEQIRLEQCSLDRGVTLLTSGPALAQPKIVIGHGTYINRHSFIDAIESVVIGREVAVGPNCYITDHDHGLDAPGAPLSLPMVSKPTRIEDQVWIGANVVILKGVTIGRGAVVGAGSVVTQSLPADVIAAGVPARVIRTRRGAAADVIGPAASQAT